MLELAKEIGLIFQTETDNLDRIQSLYFIPFRPSINGRKVVNASGILQDKYLYLRKKLKAGVIGEKDRIPEGLVFLKLSITFSQTLNFLLLFFRFLR